MGKYDPLRDRLNVSPKALEMTFKEIADLVGGLPASAHNHSAWWANDQYHVQSAAWLGVGYRVSDLKLGVGRVRFEKNGAKG